jgi:excisionase family DNA binding protein
VSEVDYATWLTKQQAADALNVSTKTIEQLTQKGQIQQGRWRRPTGGPELAVYHPDDVARLVQERRPGPAPFVLPATAAGNGHGAGNGTLATSRQPDEDARRVVAAGLSELLGAVRLLTSETSQTSERSEKSEKPAPLFLSLPEAAAATGLSEAYLRRQIAEGKLPAVRDRGWRIRRKDLEQL